MTTEYVTPLVERFATKEMAELWGAQRKFSTWRRCWIALAEAEQELGLSITDEQPLTETMHDAVLPNASHAAPPGQVAKIVPQTPGGTAKQSGKFRIVPPPARQAVSNTPDWQTLPGKQQVTSTGGGGITSQQQVVE